MIRYPLQPLLDAAGITMSRLRDVVAIGGSTYANARRIGLTAEQADRYAVKLGLHPYEVWPEMADDAAKAASVTCPECERGFFPVRSSQVYCSKRCRQRLLQREWKRNRYQSDPQFAAAQRAARRAYYAECGEYERARQRRYDKARRAA